MNNLKKKDALPQSIARSIIQAKQIIEKDISKHIPIQELARSSHTNEFTLKRFFKIMYSTTIYQHLLGERMKLANQLLETSNMLVKDIARQCGFRRLSGFVNSYKKYYGITPGRFRNLQSKDDA